MSDINSSPPKACVVGVGFVGLTLAISLCDAGLDVLGWEKNPIVSKSLELGETDIIEPGIKPKLKQYVSSGNLKMVNSWEDAAKATVFIITVGTPLKNAQIDLLHINEAIVQLLPSLKDGDLVIIRSTTAIGTCTDLILPMLKTTQKNVLFAMCPERTVEGKALIEMAALPQIIGAKDEESFQAASNFFSLLGPEIVRVSSLESAELAKLINNTYRDLMFAFANEIADISLSYGINPSEIIQAANHNYKRSNIALPGISGGPCLEKDPWILVESGRRKGLAMEISSSSRIVNEKTISRFLDNYLQESKNPEKISILGLAFKGEPVTQDIRGSAIFPLTEYLCEKFPGVKIVGFEPAGLESIPGLKISIAKSIEEAVSNADIIVMLTNALAFSSISDLIANLAMEKCLILDFWKRNFNGTVLSSQVYKSWAGE